jgi:hypothetical protein
MSKKIKKKESSEKDVIKQSIKLENDAPDLKSLEEEKHFEYIG